MNFEDQLEGFFYITKTNSRFPLFFPRMNDDPYPNDITRFVFNCVLQKDGVHDIEGIAEYLEMAAEAGISNTSFISMIPANGYCMDQFVDPEMFNLENDSRFRVWNHFHDYEYCSCSAGDYRARKGWVRYYYRSPGKEKAPYSRQLVYTENNRLLDGFGGNQIYV